MNNYRENLRQMQFFLKLFVCCARLLENKGNNEGLGDGAPS